MSVLTEKTAAPAGAPPMTHLDRLEPLNLSRRPFTNTRPVARAAVALWLLGLLLLLGNILLFRNYLASSTEKRAELSRMEMQILKENRLVSQLETQLANSNLEQQNRQVRFLNRRIAERTFSWSQLFDHLSAVLPDGVRINRLTPTSLVDSKEQQSYDTAPARARDERVTLTIDGEAKSDEALSVFVNKLFARPFDEPDLTRESREDEDLVKFDIKALYLPSAGAATPALPAPASTPAPAAPEISAAPGFSAPSAPTSSSAPLAPVAPQAGSPRSLRSPNPAGVARPSGPAKPSPSRITPPALVVEEAGPTGRMPALKTPNASGTPGIVPSRSGRPGRGA